MKKLSQLFFIVFVFAMGCNHPKSNKISKRVTLKEVAASTDTSFLADKNFRFKNLQSTLPLWKGRKFYMDNMSGDSTKKDAVVELTKAQRLNIIVPFITKELNVKDASVVEDFMRAYLVAKQDKIGEFQPIILFIASDDYSSLTLIVLNKHNVAVSGFNLCGGLDSGPYSTGDSLTTYDANSFSNINKNQIITCRISNSDFADSLRKPSIVDSVVFKSVIDKSGKIITKQIVKAQYRKPYKAQK